MYLCLPKYSDSPFPNQLTNQSTQAVIDNKTHLGGRKRSSSVGPVEHQRGGSSFLRARPSTTRESYIFVGGLS